MRLTIRIAALTLLVNLSATSGLVRADLALSKGDDGSQPVDVRGVLEKSQVAGALPEGMVVRLTACLGGADAKAPDGRQPEELREMWEFTSEQVHRVQIEDDKNGKSVYRRIESRPFHSSEICKALLDGKAIEIQAKKGEGPETVLAGTPYRIGSRSVEVVWNGQTLLDLHETNGPFLNAYRETDAKAFGSLYEKLAGRARAVFESKPGEAE